MSILFKRKSTFEYGGERDEIHSWISRPLESITYDESQWGSEAKNGYSYCLALNPIRCELCLRKIDSREIRHKFSKRLSRYLNGCIYCRPDWRVQDAD